MTVLYRFTRKNIFIPLKSLNLSSRKLYFFPKNKKIKIMILFPHNLIFGGLVSPLLMVSREAVRLLRSNLSTPLLLLNRSSHVDAYVQQDKDRNSILFYSHIYIRRHSQ